VPTTDHCSSTTEGSVGVDAETTIYGMSRAKSPTTATGALIVDLHDNLLTSRDLISGVVSGRRI
jgi:hypothetical protein